MGFVVAIAMGSSFIHKFQVVCGCDFTWLFGFNTIWGFEPQVSLGTQSEK
jgi:hypothetical protein